MSSLRVVAKKKATSKEGETILLPVADLKTTFDVRRGLNDDRVLLFMELYESGEPVPPIEVVRGTMDIHDGRHRKAALEHLNRKNAECVLVAPMPFVEQIMDAFSKNMSHAPLPPTRVDIMFVMKQLLEADVPNAQIQKRFEAFYRPSHVRKLLKDAHSNLVKAKVARAKQAVAHDGLTVKVAAEQYGVTPEQLQVEITGMKRQRKATSIAAIKTEVSNRYRGNSRRTGILFGELIDKFIDGELSEKSVLEVILHVQRLNADASKRIEHWIERLTVAKGSMRRAKS